MIRMTVEVSDDSTDDVVDAISDAIASGLEEVAAAIAENARGYAPVKTGALRDSIGYDVSGDEATVGAAVPYAIEQELGGRYHGAANGGMGFLTPAVMNHEGELASLFEEEFE